MGAVTGGAGGAFLGHKAGHGFLGAIAGAISGSLAEDEFKKHRQQNQQGGGSGRW